MNNIDIESLRKNLIDYYESAVPIFGVAIMDVIRVERANDLELIAIARECGFNLINIKVFIKKN